MTIENDLTQRFEQSGSSLDEAREMYQDGYNGSGFGAELTDQKFAYRYASTGDDEMSLRSSVFLGQITGAIQPKDEYVVSWLSAGTSRIDEGADESVLEIGRPAMFPTGKRFVFHMSDYRQNLVHFDARFLERLEAERTGTLPMPLQFDHTAVPNDDALLRWKQAIATVASTVFGPDTTSLQFSEAKRLAAEALLDTFAHRPPEEQALVLSPRLGRLRAAIEFIHAHPEDDLSPTAIAAASGLSLRGLQQAFSQHLDSTPTEYLRGVRLDHVRAELLELSPEEVTVSGAARRWGFLHASRFSAAYHSRFGEYPSATLRR